MERDYLYSRYIYALKRKRTEKEKKKTILGLRLIACLRIFLYSFDYRLLCEEKKNCREPTGRAAAAALNYGGENLRHSYRFQHY